MNNILKVGLITTVLTCAIVLFGRLLGGPTAMALAPGLAGFLNFGSYWFSSAIVLKMGGAGGALLKLFSTHPPTEKRIAALEGLLGVVSPQSSAGAWN